MRIIEWVSLEDDIEEENDERVIQVPVVVNQSPLNNQKFNLYIGHTNFKLNNTTDLDKLNSIEGVEMLRILTRYRFVIAVGDCFDFYEIAADIENKFECYTRANKNINNDIFNLIIKKSEEYSEITPYWCLYIFPNSEISHCECKNLEELDKAISFYEKCKKLSDGIIIWPKGLEIPNRHEDG